MTLFTKLIRDKMKRKGDSYERLARALKCSPAFAKHIASSDIVPVSPRLIQGLSKRYGIGLKRLETLAVRRNRIGKRYYREWRSKHAA